MGTQSDAAVLRLRKNNNSEEPDGRLRLSGNISIGRDNLYD